MGLMPNENSNPADSLVRNLCREAATSQGGSVLSTPDVASRGAGSDNPSDMNNDEQDSKLGGWDYETTRKFGEGSNVAEEYFEESEEASCCKKRSK